MLKASIASWRAGVTRRFGVPLALIGLVTGFSPLTSTVAAHGGTMQNYLVLYSASAVPADAGASLARAGGTLVYSYPQIGVAIARSESATFGSDASKDGRVDGVSATAAFATKLTDDVSPADDAASSPPGSFPNAPSGEGALFPLQWDMRQINADQAHKITGGSPAVIAGDIDTGLDFTHLNLAPHVDFADSVSCIGGVPNQAPSAWNDDNGHGTHTAGTMAAPNIGFGITGVAPNVRIAAIKAGDAAGFFFPEAVVCAFVWAGTHHISVTNNSYFADPFLFNCKNDPVQRAIWKAEQRAIRFAMQQGTVVVAAEGNQADDLSHPTQDVTSPDNTTPVVRPVHNDCVVIPVEIPGVIGVTGDGHDRQSTGGFLKSFFSSYGVSTASVVAPSGDSRFGRNAEAPNGRVLSTYPARFITNIAPSRRVESCDPTAPAVCAFYAYLQGTSMASPHVAGVAALIISEFGPLPPGTVAAIIDQTADPQPCASAAEQAMLTASFPAIDNGAPQVCQGGTGHNSWYGSGQVDALSAVTRTP